MNSTVGFTQTAAAITATAAQILAENSSRNYLLVQNNGAGIVYLNFSGTATTSNGIKLESGQAYEPEEVPSNAISAISDATASVILIEG